MREIAYGSGGALRGDTPRPRKSRRTIRQGSAQGSFGAPGVPGSTMGATSVVWSHQ